MVIKKSKKAWTRIIEVFVAILLIIGVLMIILKTENNFNNRVSKRIYDVENSILRNIEYNTSLRQEILDENKLPVEFKNISTNVKNKIRYKTPAGLSCTAKICEYSSECILDVSGTEIYTKKFFVSSTITTYAPRKLKLFCWPNV